VSDVALTKSADQILDTLSRMDHPVTRRDLANIHMFSEEVRRAVAELNEAGYPVVSVGSGFSLAKKASLVQGAANLLLAQASALVDRASRLEKLAKSLES